MGIGWFKAQEKIFSVSIVEMKRALKVRAGETILQAALGEGLPFPHLCRVGSCGRCKCRLIKGRTKTLVDLSYVLSANEIRDGYILACQSIVTGDCEVSVTVKDDASPDDDLDLDAIEWPD
jgi:ferredoxin